MSYKSRFRPSEVLVGGIWRVLEDQPSRRAPVAGDSAGARDRG